MTPRRNPPSSAEPIHIFWFAGMSCDGCTIALTGAANPSLEKLLRGSLGGSVSRVVLHHPFLAVDSGEQFLAPHRRAVRGELDAPYIVVMEGSATDEDLAGAGYWAALGTGGIVDRDAVINGVAQPVPTMDWIRALAPAAVATIAVGTCASWGGVPAARGNVTGARSLGDLLGQDYRSTLGLPVVNIPGCAPVGDNLIETLAALLLFLAGVGPVPELDDLGRPAWLFGDTVHRRCVKAGFYEEGVFARSHGEKGCLVELGCWGAVVQCNITERGAINGMGGCMNSGGACIGCTMPGFPDAFAPFAEAGPAEAYGSPADAHVPSRGGEGLRLLPIATSTGSQGAVLSLATSRRSRDRGSDWTFPERVDRPKTGRRPPVGVSEGDRWAFWTDGSGVNHRGRRLWRKDREAWAGSNGHRRPR